MIVNTIKDIFPFIEDIKIVDYSFDGINDEEIEENDYFDICPDFIYMEGKEKDIFQKDLENSA